MQLDGQVRYDDVDDVCLASSSRGSVRSAFNRRDPEFHLLDAFLNFHWTSGGAIWGGIRDRLGTKIISDAYTDGQTFHLGDADDRFPDQNT